MSRCNSASESAAAGNFPAAACSASRAPRFRTGAVFCFCCLLLAGAARADDLPRSAYQGIQRLLDQGRNADAERALSGILQHHPRDVTALGLMAVVSDSYNRHDEAEAYYTKALEIAPNSVFILNNLGHHYLAQKHFRQARDIFSKVLVLDGANSYAILQLAELSVSTHQGSAALGYLNRLPRAQQTTPDPAFLRAQALGLLGQRDAGVALLEHVLDHGSASRSLYFSIGLLFAEWHRYRQAETAFERALESEPENVNIQYNLGLASAQAGDLQRARYVFEHALEQHPDDVDFLFHVGLVYQQQGDYARALGVLMQATTRAPKRAPILLSIAQVTEKLGLYGDSARAYDRYLTVEPDDAAARRERGFALASSGELSQGLADLRWFFTKHPQDPDGLFELGIAEASDQPDAALDLLNRAIGYRPQWVAAHYTRAALSYQQGRIKDARKDLDYVLSKMPDNVLALDLLGRIELHRNNPEKAADALSRGLKVAPNNPQLLLHYSQALRRLSRGDEAEVVAAKFKSLGADAGGRPADPWVFDFFALSPSQQGSKYIENLRSSIATMPRNPQLRVALARALLAEGKTEDAVEAFREVRELTSDVDTIAQCGRDLLDAGLNQEAEGFLRSARSFGPVTSQIVFDLVIATFRSAGPEPALAVLESLPAGERKGEYFLLKAELQETLTKPEQVLEALRQVTSREDSQYLASERPAFYLELSALLLLHQRYQEALDVLRRGQRATPDDRTLLLGEAVANSLAGHSSEANDLLARVEKKWPEWSRVYLVRGAVLARSGDYPGAIAALKTAIALGTETSVAAYYLAVASRRVALPDLPGISRIAIRALQLEPRNPYCLLFAGVVAYRNGDYQEALNYLQPLASLTSGLAEPHRALAETYRALGRVEDAAKEVAIAEQRERATAEIVGSIPILLGAKLRVSPEKEEVTQ